MLSHLSLSLSLKLKETFSNISVDLPGVINIKDYQLILEEFNKNKDFFVYMGG